MLLDGNGPFVEKSSWAAAGAAPLVSAGAPAEPQAALAQLATTVPLGRVGQPEEVASVVSFLASDEASYMCGALVEITGGKAVY